MALTPEEEMARLKETVEYLKQQVGCWRSGGTMGKEDGGSSGLGAEVAELKKTVRDLVEKMTSVPAIQIEAMAPGALTPNDASRANVVSAQSVLMEVSKKGSGNLGVTAPKGTSNAPPGMTPEQQAELKKMNLQVNSLQQKLKDVESKLSDAASGIVKGQERVTELEEKSQESTKEIYASLDSINNSLSEKIAKQKVEVQKIAGDQPKPINYDPFNYGEAYGGDLVDFQARKRIIEIKLLLQGLQMTMNQMRDSVKVSPQIDLGYNVYRLDQLVGSTGFAKGVREGRVKDGEALLVGQSNSRTPDKVHYPRMEAFKTDEEHTSKWAITDTIMQTMYRLESELGDLQKIVRASEMTSNSNALDEIFYVLKQLKDTKTEDATVKKMIEDALASFKVTSEPHVSAQPNSAQSDNLVEKLLKVVKHMGLSVESLEHRLTKMETLAAPRVESAGSKSKSKGKNCLSCDREIDMQPTKREKSDRYKLSNEPHGVEKSPRLRYLLNRQYEVNINNEIVDIYSMPRPCGASYAQSWPRTWSHNVASHTLTPLDPPAMPCVDEYYMIGHDGRIYKGDKDFYKKGPNVCVMKAQEQSIYQGQQLVADRSGLTKKGVKNEMITRGQKMKNVPNISIEGPTPWLGNSPMGFSTPPEPADPYPLSAEAAKGADDDDNN